MYVAQPKTMETDLSVDVSPVSLVVQHSTNLLRGWRLKSRQQVRSSAAASPINQRDFTV